nr:unnamed protein product [Callosobruchus chinensis]
MHRFLTGVLLVTSHSSTGIQTDSAPPTSDLYNTAARCTRGGRSSYIKNRTIRPHFCPQDVQTLERTVW